MPAEIAEMNEAGGAVRALPLLRLRRQPAPRSRGARWDTAAFALLYEHHHQELYRYCRFILRHDQDAQDALQSTMARAFAALRQERRDFELRPWLFRIAHNEAVSILRRRPDTAELPDTVGALGRVEDRVAERADLRDLRADLGDLPRRQRTALVLRELNGLGHAEIAAVLECTPAAVKQAIADARSALLECRAGREMACDGVRRVLSDGDRRMLRGRRVRAHLRTCADCRRFRTALERRIEHPAVDANRVGELPDGQRPVRLAKDRVLQGATHSDRDGAQLGHGGHLPALPEQQSWRAPPACRR